MPGDALDNVVIQTLFAMCWSTLFSMLMLGGLFVAPRSFGGLLSHWTVFFLSFVSLVVSDGRGRWLTIVDSFNSSLRVAPSSSSFRK